MELTAEQVDIKKAAREFAEGEFRERAREFDEKERSSACIREDTPNIPSAVIIITAPAKRKRAPCNCMLSVKSEPIAPKMVPRIIYELTRPIL